MFWLRLGDAGDYESFDSLASVADHLAEFNVYIFRRFVGTYGVGIEAPGFTGMNMISLYFGDAEAQLVRPMDNSELKALKEFLADRACNVFK